MELENTNTTHNQTQTQLRTKYKHHFPSTTIPINHQPSCLPPCIMSTHHGLNNTHQLPPHTLEGQHTHTHQPQWQQQVPAQSTVHGEDLNDPPGMCHIIQMAMMACIGQVSNVLPPSFSCLTATMPSGHHNTHRHITPSPSATLGIDDNT